jgi:CelD/BcsL family acetyltransferase involved in cellulose biosynthesis
LDDVTIATLGSAGANLPVQAAQPQVLSPSVSNVHQMQARILTDWPAVRMLAPEWNALLEDSAANSIFLTWEWMSCWIDIHGETAAPFVVVARNSEGQLTGILPLYIARATFGRVVPFRILRYLAEHASGLEYPDWIVRRSAEEEAVQALAEALANASGEWDCLWMTRVAGWTGAFERIHTGCARVGFHLHHRPHSFAMATLADTLDGFMKQLSSQRRWEIRNRKKKVFERQGVEIRCCATPDEVDGMLDALFHLHHQRRMLLGDTGAFQRKPEEAEFYRRFARLALARGWLRLYGLAEAGNFKAIQIGYVYNNVFNSLQEGFDPAYQDGVGNVLRLRVVEDCIANGIRELDYLGEMTQHKRLWRAVERTGHDLFIGHRSLKNRLMFTKEVWPTGRYVRWRSAP